MRKTLAIFDFDGTLFFETFDLNTFAINKSLESIDLPPITQDQLIQSIGDTLPNIVKRLIKTDDKEKVNHFCEVILSFADEYIQTRASFKPDVVQMIKTLKESGATLCICSNGDKRYLYSLLDRFDLTEYFDTIWYAKEGIQKNEAVAIIKRKYESDRCFMIGDREEDIIAGKTNDCITIGVVAEYEGFSVSGAENFDISGADYLISSHLDIIRIIAGKEK